MLEKPIKSMFHYEGKTVKIIGKSRVKIYEELYNHDISAVVCIADRPMAFDRSLARTEELLEAAADRTIRLLRLGAAIGL